MKEKINVFDPYGSGSFEMVVDEKGKLLSMERVCPNSEEKGDNEDAEHID